MKLGFQIGDEYLDLRPDTVVELEENNPLLRFSDLDQIGTYSFPFTVDDTPKNRRLTRYASYYQAKIDNAGIDARTISNGLQHSVGKIKIEKPSFNKTKSGSISLYYLVGASAFFQDAKDKKMRDANYGGDRTFAGGGDSLVFYSTAFGQHIKNVMLGAPGAYDYAFYPVANSGISSEPWNNRDLMNKVQYFGGVFIPLPTAPIIPFPYLSYVLQQAITYAGWTMEGDLLNDVDFKKITLINFRAIDFSYQKKISGVTHDIIFDNITFNLQDHVPNMTIGEFVLAFRNRFGLYYDFDYVNKKVIVKMLRDQVSAVPKDMTAFSSPVITKPIRNEKIVYALRNNFIAGGGEGINLALANYQGEVVKTVDLPAPAEALYAQVYLVIEENNYYICLQNQDSEAWEWEIHSGQIFDYAPDGANQDIETSATTVEMVKYDALLDLIPRCDNDVVQFKEDNDPEWGIHLCFFFGPRANKAGDVVPFASHHIYDSQGNQLAAWSLAFKGKKSDGTEVGLFDLNWKGFLEMVSGDEQVECTLNLPYYLYRQLKPTDQLIIDGVKMFVDKVKPKLPYDGSVDLECVRIV